MINRVYESPRRAEEETWTRFAVRMMMTVTVKQMWWRWRWRTTELNSRFLILHYINTARNTDLYWRVAKVEPQFHKNSDKYGRHNNIPSKTYNTLRNVDVVCIKLQGSWVYITRRTAWPLPAQKYLPRLAAHCGATVYKQKYKSSHKTSFPLIHHLPTTRSIDRESASSVIYD